MRIIKFHKRFSDKYVDGELFYNDRSYSYFHICNIYMH